MPDIVAAVHFTPELGAIGDNREAVVELAETAAREAQVVVLPELCVTGFRISRDQAPEWAEPIEGPTIKALGRVAKAQKTVVVVGLALQDPEGLLRNAQVVLDADGTLAGVYAKHHLYADDLTWAQPGSNPGGVALTSYGKVGLLICHDVVYPRTVIAVGQRSPRLVALSTAWIGDGEALPNSWAMATQLLDPTPLVVANRGGVEGALAFEDPSAILSFSAGGVVGARGEGPYVIQAAIPG